MFDDHAIRAFREELLKEAGALGQILRNSRVHSALGGAGALGGLGAAIGGIGGAASGGVRAYQDARDEGVGVGGALMHGAGGALGGAQHGALLGGGLGAAVGALGGAAAPGAVEGLRKRLTSSGLPGTQFGQRQVHALTGWRPGADVSSIREIGAGAAGAQKNLASAVEAANTLSNGAPGKGLDRAVGKVQQARKAYGASVRAERMGLTSLPGYAKSVHDNGLLPTMSAGFKEQWHGMSPGWKALMIGAPAAEAIHEYGTPDQEGGPGKAERVGRGVANAVAGATMGGIPALTSQFLVSPAISAAGGLVGKGIDKVRGRTPPRNYGQYMPAETSGQVLPAERLVGGGAQESEAVT